ncbi:MAG: hypothetical protein NMNS01_30310 [Nitrosomonas sp.]|nr:MAG: hypothetical protein NMNS01_30310 [Nitrosomonas sp.]
MVYENTSTQKKQKMLIELKVQKGSSKNEIFSLIAGFNISNFVLDNEFEPVPIPASNDISNQMSPSEEVIIVRATVEEESIEKLKALPGYIAMWQDGNIAGFSQCLTEDDAAVQVAGEPQNTCPIAPCDCSPTVAKGGIPDVVKYLGVDDIWAKNYKGENIVIGIVDGGIKAKGRVSDGDIDRVIGGFPSDWGKVARWNRHGHMTATDALGMAPQAKIYDIRISDHDSISAALAGFNWAIQQHKQNGTPHILSNSWGSFQENWDREYARNPNHPFTRKVVEAINEGILVVFAAGNCGQTCPDGRCEADSGPARSIWGANGHPLVMTVGAANLKEQWIGYSSQGPAALDARKPDFCAISHFKGYFSSDSGTSAACPVAAGVLALLKQVNPSLTQSQAKEALSSSCKNIGSVGWDKHSGHGIIRANVAYQLIHTSRYIGVWRRGNDPYYLWVNASWNSFRSKWQELGDKNLRLVDFESKLINGNWRYSGVWRHGSDPYYLWANASWDSFRSKWQELGAKNLRLVDFESKLINGNWQYSGVWRHGTDPYYLWVNASWSNFVAKWQELGAKNLRLIDISITQIGNSLRYSGVWRHGTDPYYLWANASWSNFVAKWKELGEKNLRLIDIEQTQVGDQRRYTGVWRHGSDPYYLWNTNSWESFVQKWKDLGEKNLRLIDFENATSSDGAAGVLTLEGVSSFSATSDGAGGGTLELTLPNKGQKFSSDHQDTMSNEGENSFGFGGGNIDPEVSTNAESEGGGMIDLVSSEDVLMEVDNGLGFGGGQTDEFDFDEGFGGGSVEGGASTCHSNKLDLDENISVENGFGGGSLD